jgi:hypothetical protein
MAGLRAILAGAVAAVGLATCVARADRILSVEVEGTHFKVALESGRLLDSSSLVGAELDLGASGGAARRIRIVEVQKDATDPDGDILLHRIVVSAAAGQWTDFCRPDANGNSWAFPLRGQWDSAGLQTSENGLTLTCTSGAIGKCVRFGYKPWKIMADGTALTPFHAACVRAVRADYCANGATTRDGQLIDIFDALGIQHADPAYANDVLPFEAAFSPTGALCVAHARVPENMTLDTLSAECPGLRGRLGEQACRESDALAGRYGTPMVFIRSPASGRIHPPSQVESPARGPVGSSGRSNPNTKTL